RPMVERLLGARFRMVLADADPARLTGLGARAVIAASFAELGRRSDVVVTMLPDGKTVRAVLCGTRFGDDCVVAGLAAGALVIDMSSSSPVGTRKLGATLAKSGIRFVDAPVSGGVKRAVDGTLAIMAGGTAEDVAEARPIFAALGREVFPTGPLGSGHAMK